MGPRHVEGVITWQQLMWVRFPWQHVVMETRVHLWHLVVVRGRGRRATELWRGLRRRVPATVHAAQVFQLLPRQPFVHLQVVHDSRMLRGTRVIRGCPKQRVIGTMLLCRSTVQFCGVFPVQMFIRVPSVVLRWQVVVFTGCTAVVRDGRSTFLVKPPALLFQRSFVFMHRQSTVTMVTVKVVMPARRHHLLSAAVQRMVPGRGVPTVLDAWVVAAAGWG